MTEEIVIRMPDLSEVRLKLWGRSPLALSLTRNERVILEGTDVEAERRRLMRKSMEEIEAEVKAIEAGVVMEEEGEEEE
ncbi:MAG: hypothetical protein ACXQTD_01430 [Candidatus Syntropharchaeia archaeon]